MNQIKNIFWKNYQEWCWTLLQWSALLSFFLFLFGPALWIQSVVLSIMALSCLALMFASQVRRSFEGVILKGYDPWHLKSLREQYLPQVDLIVHSHPTPFLLGYDFYKKRKLILSSAFVKHFNKEELTAQLRAASLLFECGFFQKFTWMSYFFFLIFLPFLPFLFVFKKVLFLKRAVESAPSFLCLCILFPFRYWIDQKYYTMDEELSSLFETKKKYSEWIWKMHTFWNVSNRRPSVFLTSLFLTNPLTQKAFSLNIHPCIERRIEKLTGAFPI